MTDGERVYAYFGNVGVFAFDMDGMPVWSHPIGPFPSRTGWGTAASPVLHDRRLYIVCDNEEQSFLVAFDARTGKQIWRVERDEKSSWSTPHIWQHDGKTEIVTNASSRIRSYDLDGKLLWELGGASSIAIPTPVSRFGMVYISSGYVQDENRPVFAVRPGGTIAWSLPQGGPYNTSPLIYGDHYYTLFDRGFFTSHDARTGKEIYGKVRIDPTAGAFTASPWAYNGTDLRAQRGRRHFRDPGGSGVPAARQELAGRDDAGHTRDCPRKPLHPDRFTAVSYPPAQGD